MKIDASTRAKAASVCRQYLGKLSHGQGTKFDHTSRVIDNIAQLVNGHHAGKNLTNHQKESTFDHAYICGWLHDVLEDSDVQIDDLVLPNEKMKETLRLITRTSDKTYQEYLDSIVQSGDPIAVIIKLADNMDNNHPVNITRMPPEMRSITKRYDRAFHALRDKYVKNCVEL